MPDIPADEQVPFDVAGANAMLDEAGYLDTDGDGTREMPGGGDNIVLRHGVNTDSTTYPAISELFVGWMEAIGFGVELQSYDGGALFEVIVNGDYDTFVWGWTPFVDPDPMLSYFTSTEIGNYNDANWTDPQYDALYEEQNQELDPDRRREIVHEMLTLMYDAGVYYPIYYSPDLQAYRSDRFEGWIRQPADIGPVMFSNTSPSYFELQPIGGAAGGGVSPRRPDCRRRVASGDHCLSSHELPEEAGNCGRPRVNPRFAVGKIVGALVTLGFVLVFNFFLFRVVQTDPVATLFRGRNIPQARLDQLREEFGLDKPLAGQFVDYLGQTAQLNLGLSYQSRQPVWTEIKAKIPATVALVGTSAVLSAVIGTALGVAAAWRRGSKTDYGITTSTMVFYSMPDFWLGMLLLVGGGIITGLFPIGGMVDAGSARDGFGRILDQAHHMALPALTLTLAYLGEYAIVARSSLLETMKEDYLLVARCQGSPRREGAQSTCDSECPSPRGNPQRHQLRICVVRSNRGRNRFLVAGPRQGNQRRDSWAGPTDAAGLVSALQRRCDRVQPDRGSRVWTT